MDLSENAKERIENLSPRVRAACCKALKQGDYNSVRLQVRVRPLHVIEIFELIDELSIENISAYLKTSSLEYIKANKKSTEI